MVINHFIEAQKRMRKVIVKGHFIVDQFFSGFSRSPVSATEWKGRISQSESDGAQKKAAGNN